MYTYEDNSVEQKSNDVAFSIGFGGKLALILGLGVVGGVWKTGTVVIPIN